MSRSANIAFGVGLSLTFDALLWFLFMRRARIKDHDPSVYWWLLTIIISVAALIPLLEMARRGRIAERILAAVLSVLPVAWTGLCAYVRFTDCILLRQAVRERVDLHSTHPWRYSRRR